MNLFDNLENNMNTFDDLTENKEIKRRRRLTKEEIQDIVTQYRNNKMSQKELAEKYGVSQCCISINVRKAKIKGIHPQLEYTVREQKKVIPGFDAELDKDYLRKTFYEGNDESLRLLFSLFPTEAVVLRKIGQTISLYDSQERLVVQFPAILFKIKFIQEKTMQEIIRPANPKYWKGCLCIFRDDQDDKIQYGTLNDYIEGYGYEMKESGKIYKHCQPVMKRDIEFIEDRKEAIKYE